MSAAQPHTGLCSAHRDGEDAGCRICYPAAPERTPDTEKGGELGLPKEPTRAPGVGSPAGLDGAPAAQSRSASTPLPLSGVSHGYDTDGER